MKHLYFLLITILLQSTAIAQETDKTSRFRSYDDTETLANRKGGFGGFLEINTMPTYLNNQPGLMAGGGLSLVFGHSLNLGFAGYGLVTDIESNWIDTTGNPYYLQTGYGGMTIEPVLWSKKLIHVSFPVLLGAGMTSLTSGSLYSSETYDNEWQNTEMYFIVRPGLNIEINLLRILRLDLGVNYRFTGGYHLQNVQASGLDGFGGNIGLKLGWF